MTASRFDGSGGDAMTRERTVEGIDWSVKRISLSWHRWTEYRSFVPRRELGLRWTAWQWAWFRFEVER